MTFWKTDKTDTSLVKETIRTLGELQIPDSVRKSPEWACVTEATENLNAPVLAVALEVLASHHSKEMKSADVELIEAIADCIRCSRVGEMKALVDLVHRSAGGLQQAA